MCKQTDKNLEKHTIRVFVADSDKEVAQSIQLLLNTAEIMSYIFDSGQSMLEKTIAEPPDCIVMAALLPDLDGLTIMERLKAHNLSTPVILLGGNSHIPAVVHAVKSGIWDYFEKPFIQHALIDSVCKAISQNSKT